MQISARQIAGMRDGPAFLVSLILFSLSLYQANATPRSVRIWVRVGPCRNPDTKRREVGRARRSFPF